MEQKDSEELTIYYFLLPILSTLLIGTVMAGIKIIVGFFQDRFIQNVTSSLYIESTDPLFKILFSFLVEKGYSTQSTSSLAVYTERKNKVGWVINDVNDDPDKPELSYKPDVGYHSFIYKGFTVNVLLYSGKSIITGWERSPTKMESLILSCFGPKNIDVLKQLCDEALEHTLTNKEKGETHVYALRPYGCLWEKVQSKRPRPLETVILDSNVAEEVITDVRNFLKNQNWYIQRGVPYRRGYLLYGPPGTGKTSFILAVVAELKLSVCTLNLVMEMDDNDLNLALGNAPRNAVILLEDVDAIFVERSSVNESRQGRKISFSGLLNAIDGVRTQEGRILFMTTNHKEKLDEALLRPGRSDVHVKLDFASQNQIRRMFKKFYPESTEGMVEEFLRIVPEKKVSMAKLQGHFLRNKGNPENALATAQNLVELKEFTSDMSIVHWLFRLNLAQHTDSFLKEHILTASDLQNISEQDLNGLGVKKEGEKKRIMSMIKGDELSKKAFRYLSRYSLSSYLGHFVKNSQEIESFVELVPEDCITEFHVRDLFEKEEIGRSLEEKTLELRESIMKFRAGKKIIEKEEPKRYSKKETPKEILERLSLGDFIEKFREQGVLDPLNFAALNEGLVKGLGVESLGLRKILMAEIKKFGKAEEEEKEEDKLSEIKKVLQKTKSIQY